MMPTSWASRRSMARWVLPVVVGPSTAVTPRPRIAPELERIRLIRAVLSPTDSVSAFSRLARNEGGTNLVRIADLGYSDFVLTGVSRSSSLLSRVIAQHIFATVNQPVEAEASPEAQSPRGTTGT